MFYNDPFMPLIFVAFIFSLWASWQVKGTFKKFSEIAASSGLTAAEVARKILNASDLRDIPVERVAGELTDNYDPIRRILSLSSPVYDSTSIAAYGIAAHEAGHALQHAKSFGPLMLRNKIYPVASLGSNFGPILFFLGILFSINALLDIGIIFFTGAVVFSLITLPVEYDASRRAMAILADGSYLTIDEQPKAKKVLDAAALTYLAGTLMAILELVRLLFLRSSRD